MTDQLQGRVIAAHGRHYSVELSSGSLVKCYPRGKRNEATVGDFVRVVMQASAEASLEEVLERKNLLYRSDEAKSKQFAANVDQLLIVVAVEPSFSDDLLGRALAGAWSANITPVILLNKVDLVTGLAAARKKLEPYTKLGVQIIDICAHDTQSVKTNILPLLHAKTSLLLGQSAMGKSTLLNTLVPGAMAATQAHSVALGAGRHTTTSTRLYHLPWADGDLIDSPGFQAFGLLHLSLQEIEQGFPEFSPYKDTCRFYNCTHQHEPGCGVLAALKQHKLDATRHALYIRLIEAKAANDQRY
jgi:ribosome biogenesis GTPase / thiamine phosphate phosphatase